MSKIIRKITTTAVCGKMSALFDKLLETEGRRLDLMTVYGFGKKARPDASEYGEFVRFQGQFAATNLLTGEEFRAGSMILPGVAQDLLAGALSGENVSDVQFAFKVSVHYDAEAATKYVYEVESLVAPAENDPMELLRKQIKTGNLLAAPTPEPEGDKPEPEGDKPEPEDDKGGKKK